MIALFAICRKPFAIRRNSPNDHLFARNLGYEFPRYDTPYGSSMKSFAPRDASKERGALGGAHPEESAAAVAP